MKVAVLGGTGDFGGGIALRLADAGHDVVVGSRKEESAEEAAEEYADKTGGKAKGATNADAVVGADAVVLGVPPNYAVDTVEDVSEKLEAPLVTPVVSMSREEGDFVYTPPEEGSCAEAVRNASPDLIPVAGAFHNVAAGKLADLETDLEVDIAVFGDEEAKEVASTLVEDAGARPLDAGGFGVAPEVEALTPLLINVGVKNGMRDLGVRFV